MCCISGIADRAIPAVENRLFKKPVFSSTFSVLRGSVVTDNATVFGEDFPMGQSYRQLIAWQKSMDFVMDVYKVTKSFPSR
jgi:hypothetical protein